MTAPAVSVVMPIYKPVFLTTAIDSVLAQTMRDFELILINDGSPHKRTDEIAAAFAAEDLRVHYLRQDNKGVAAARNAGVAAARAPYIMFMDDDDISAPGRMATQLRFLQSHPQVAAVGCQVLFIDANGEEDKNTKGDSPFPKLSETVIQQPPPLRGNPIAGYIGGQNQMIRKAAYNEIGGMREYFRIGEDKDFCYRLEERFAVAMIAQPLYHYRISHDSHQQLSQHSDIGLYLPAAECSAHCRRNGMPDIIGDSPPPLETLLTNAAANGIISRIMVLKIAKKYCCKNDTCFCARFSPPTKRRADAGMSNCLSNFFIGRYFIGAWAFGYAENKPCLVSPFQR